MPKHALTLSLMFLERHPRAQKNSQEFHRTLSGAEATAPPLIPIQYLPSVYWRNSSVCGASRRSAKRRASAIHTPCAARVVYLLYCRYKYFPLLQFTDFLTRYPGGFEAIWCMPGWLLGRFVCGGTVPRPKPRVKFSGFEYLNAQIGIKMIVCHDVLHLLPIKDPFIGINWI